MNPRAITPGPSQDDAVEGRTVRVRAAMSSDVGKVRDRNEDAACVDLELQLFMVADGVGGNAAGEVASAMTIDIVHRRLQAARAHIEAFAAAPSSEGREKVSVLLECAVRGAHQAVCDRARREPDKYGMATTLDVLLIAGSELFLAHVGDSRAYLIRDGQATLITRDHTSAQMMVGAGWLSSGDALGSPMRSVLLNAIGMGTSLTVDMVNRELSSRDRVLLCSDGLYEYCPTHELAHHLSCGGAEQKLAELVELARERGGHDNITGVIAEVIFSRHPNTVPRSRSTPPPIPGSRHPRPQPRMPSPSLPPSDRWEDEPTTPRIPQGTLPPPSTPRAWTPAVAQAPRVPATQPQWWGNPMDEVSEDTLVSFVERTLREDNGRTAA